MSSSGSGISNKSGSANITTGATSAVEGNTAATSAGSDGVFAVRDGILITTGGAQYDLSVAADVAKAKAALGAHFDDVAPLAAGSGLVFNATTGAFVADAVEAAKINKFTDDVNGKLSPEDADLLQQLKKAGLNVNPAALPAVKAALETPENAALFSEAVAAARSAITNPTAGANARVANYVNQLAVNTGANVMEILFFVFRQSIQETNEDKKYFLNKLKDYNIMADKLSDYLSDLVKSSQQLSEASAGAKYPEKVTIPVDVNSFDLSTLSSAGKVVAKEGAAQTRTLDRAGLNDTIKEVESMQEEVRNKRQMASTAFQNFDQKANQLYNLMASVLKVMNEMRSSTTRNML